MNRRNRRASRKKQKTGPTKNQLTEADKNPASDKAIVTAHTETSYSGPLPPATELDGYEQVVPGAANRIIKQFEERSQHSIWLEKSKVRTINFLLISGQLVTSTALFTSLLIGGYLIHTGKGWYGIALIAVTAAGAAKLYLDRRQDRKS